MGEADGRVINLARMSPLELFGNLGELGGTRCSDGGGLWPAARRKC